MTHESESQYEYAIPDTPDFVPQDVLFIPLLSRYALIISCKTETMKPIVRHTRNTRR